jgi:C-terminal processing protease CtpA/Prc
MRRFFTILVGFCVVAAGFFGGFSADVFREASSAAPGHTLARLGRVPGNVALALRPTPASAAADGRGGANTLSLYDTYTDVMNTIQTQYYPTGAGGNAAGNDNKAGTARAATGGVPSSTKLTYAAIRGMLRSLGDPYTVFWQPDEFKAQMDDARGEFFGIGASLDVNEKKQVYIVEPIEKSPAERAGILRGDVILAVDNKTVIGLNISSVVNRIKGKRGVPVLLTLQRGKEVVNLKIVRDVIQAPVIKARMQDPEAKIGYIQLLQFNEQADRQFGERPVRAGKAGHEGPDLRSTWKPGRPSDHGRRRGIAIYP